MQRHLGQKIAYAIAVLCYASALACVIAAFLYDSLDPNDPVRASLFASVVFFAGCGIVLHVIARARLNGLLSMSGTHDDTPGNPPD